MKIRMRTCRRCERRTPSHNFMRTLHDVGPLRFEWGGREFRIPKSTVRYRDWCCPKCRYEIDYPEESKRTRLQLNKAT